MTALGLCVAMVMAAVLLWAGLAKFTNLGAIASTLQALGVPAMWSHRVSGLVPFSEVLIALGVLFALIPRWTLVAVVALGGAFALAGLVAVLRKGAHSLQLLRLQRDRRVSGADANPRITRLGRRRLDPVLWYSDPFAASDRSFSFCCCRACDSDVEGRGAAESGSRGSRRPTLGGGDVRMAATALIAVGILSLLVFVLFSVLVELFRDVRQIRDGLGILDRPLPVDIGSVAGTPPSLYGLPEQLDDEPSALLLFLTDRCATCRVLASSLGGTLPAGLWIVLEAATSQAAEEFLREVCHDARVGGGTGVSGSCGGRRRPDRPQNGTRRISDRERGLYRGDHGPINTLPGVYRTHPF